MMSYRSSGVQAHFGLRVALEAWRVPSGYWVALGPRDMMLGAPGDISVHRAFTLARCARVRRSRVAVTVSFQQLGVRAGEMPQWVLQYIGKVVGAYSDHGV